jgi:CubicO group peptidase (beta-lactamase class C family)
MKHKIAGLILALLFFSAAFCNSQAAALSKADRAVSKKLDQYMTALADAGRFDGAVLVARNDTVLLSKGYGTANYEFSVPATPKTLFPIGSNTKQFTAAAILKLQEQGRLNIADPVTKYVPDAPRWKDIRIHHLLNHTSGIPSEGAYVTADPVDIVLPELVKRITALPLSFEPGKGKTYSNNGYITLSYIIEKASGLSYEEYLRKNIFLPLGMTATGQDNRRDVFKGRASGYTTMAGRHIHYEAQNTHNRYGAGALHSTTEDMFRWMRAFHTPGAIFTPQSSDEMVQNGYGIVKGQMNGRTVIGHGGRAVGFISYTLYYLEEGLTVIFLSNHDRTPMVTLPKDLAAIVLNESYDLPKKIDRKAVSPAPEVLKEYTGVYVAEWEKSWTFTVFSEGNHLFYTSTFPRETVELFFEGNDTFFVTPEAADSFIFTRDKNGKIDGLKMYTLEGMYDKAVRMP